MLLPRDLPPPLVVLRLAIVVMQIATSIPIQLQTQQLPNQWISVQQKVSSPPAPPLLHLEVVQKVPIQLQIQDQIPKQINQMTIQVWQSPLLQSDL